LLKLKDAPDVRVKILKDFYLQELAEMQKKNDMISVFDSNEIKACVLKARDNQNLRFAQGSPNGHLKKPLTLPR
jgi:hypothetical protein